jgi:hypothetical protein
VFGEAAHTETDGKRLSLRRIEEAARCIDEVFLGSPQYEAEAVGDELGLRLVCKVETANSSAPSRAAEPTIRCTG